MGFAPFKPIKSMANDKEEKGRGTPVISESFASPSLALGETWKIYLNASDADGDMKHIVCTIDQPGTGPSSAGFTRIKEENRQQFSGYIYLFTGGTGGVSLSNLTLTVQIQDRPGHFSNPVSFSLSFEHGAKQESPPLEVFEEKDLGPVMIPLQSPRGDG